MFTYQSKSGGQSSVGLCPGARVPTGPWIGVVPVDRGCAGCPCARGSNVVVLAA